MQKILASLIVNCRIVSNLDIRWKGLASCTRKKSYIFKKMFFNNFRLNFWKITYLRKNACSSFIINSRIIISLEDKRAWLLLQENEVMFSKYIFVQFLKVFSKNYILAYYFCVSYWLYKDILHIRWKGLMSSTRKLNVMSGKKGLEKFRLNFWKQNWHFAYSFFVIHFRIMFGIASGSV